MKSILTAVIPILIACASIAQITITYEDLLDVGDSVQLARVDSLPSNFKPGPAGPDQHWDFSNLIMDTLYTLEFIEPDSTPYGANFPASNFATSGIVESYGAEGWAYGTKNMSVFQIDGFAGSYDILEEIIAPFDPPEVMFDFPANYQDTVNSTSTLDVRLDSPEPGIDSIRVKVVTSVTSIVDGWGEISTPVWTGEVLRFRDVRITIDSAWIKVLFLWIFLDANEETMVTYKYMGNNLGYPVVQFNTDTTEAEFGQVEYNMTSNVGTEDIAWSEKADLELHPNPASGIVYCRLQNAEVEGEVEGELIIYAMTGRKIDSQPVTTDRQLYSFDVSEYPPGMYQVVFRTEEQLSAKKLIVR
jgi:hypothetical protein